MPTMSIPIRADDDGYYSAYLYQNAVAGNDDYVAEDISSDDVPAWDNDIPVPEEIPEIPSIWAGQNINHVLPPPVIMLAPTNVLNEPSVTSPQGIIFGAGVPQGGSFAAVPFYLDGGLTPRPIMNPISWEIVNSYPVALGNLSSLPNSGLYRASIETGYILFNPASGELHVSPTVPERTVITIRATGGFPAVSGMINAQVISNPIPTSVVVRPNLDPPYVSQWESQNFTAVFCKIEM